MSKEKSFDFGVFLVGIFSTAISIFLLVFDDCTGRANDFYCSHPVFSYFCLICCNRRGSCNSYAAGPCRRDDIRVT